MFCVRCGNEILPDVTNRENGIHRTLAILWLALSALRIIPGVLLIVLVVMSQQILPGISPFVVALMKVLVTVLWLNLIAGFVASWGLLSGKTWARTVAVVMGFLNLWDLPFGTALSVYTLWALLPRSEEHAHTASAIA